MVSTKTVPHTRVKAKIKKDDERLRLALRLSPSPMWIFDLESLLFLAANRPAQLQLEYSLPALKRMKLSDIIPADEHPNLYLTLKQVGRFGHFPGRWHLLPKSGQTISVSVNSSLVKFNGRNAVLVSAFASPFEGLLTENCSRYFALVANRISSAVISTDSALRIIQWNKAAEDLYGLTETEAMGCLIDEVCCTEFGEDQQSEARASLRTKKRWQGELKQHHRNGAELWVSTSVTLLEDENGNFLGGITINHDITERKKVEDDLRHTKQVMEEINQILQHAFEREQLASRTDALTGIFNRRYFFEFIEYEVALSKRYQQPFSLIMFDVDHLKLVNDTTGHQAGDEVLKQIVLLVQKELRSVDILARYGGDEFVILLPNSSVPDALILAERIRSQIFAANLRVAGSSLQVTVSIGAADFNPSVSSSAELISHADEALYSAKQAGRNCILAYSAKI
ncbi:MAG TPA: diguanylate cyclase [Anaerolineales bacterium]|nr:diguanylate cyclase [Anaerolineales bacterium]HMZ43338.1 diguanylate cyclase [Anaerolineales bacterium]HNC89498.1 diguanylate cyclase [Anaerolineales bacterium]HND90713.1 diguanylate cyclase [Anaerolineales bacterium]HNH04587.1 diguanylate cyclase [Anaerolineales bacterium]